MPRGVNTIAFNYVCEKWGDEPTKKEKQVTDSNSQSNLHIGPSQCETREIFSPTTRDRSFLFFVPPDSVYRNVAIISSTFVFLKDFKHSCYSGAFFGVYSFQPYPTNTIS